MFDERDLRHWLADCYPSLFLRRGQNGHMGIWQQDKWWIRYENERVGLDFGYLAVGYSLVFEIRDRLFGGWIKDEVQRRDPRLWHNPGNAYHEAFLLSQGAERERAKRQQRARESGQAAWDIVKRNERLMNRIAKHMERGDMLRASRELSLEELYRNAYLENPAEVRSKDFARAVSR